MTRPFYGIVSLIVSVNQCAFAFGPTILGALRDWSDNYRASFLLCIILQGVGALVVLFGQRPRRSRRLTIIFVLMVLAIGANPLWHPVEGGQASVIRTVQAVTSTGRHGTYYLPNGYDSKALPLMVGFHGSGGTGSLMIRRLQTMAERERFIALAPDSVSVAGVWSVGQRPDEVTEDYRHVMECVRELMRAPGVRVDPARVLAVGFSVGASIAPYIATHESRFTAFAVLHGHITPASFGPLRPSAWVSAGDQDRVRTVEYMRSVADYLTRASFPAVDLRVFKADHRLGDDELTALIEWWLGKR